MVANMFFLASEQVGMGGMLPQKFTISIWVGENKFKLGEIFPQSPPKENIPGSHSCRLNCLLNSTPCGYFLGKQGSELRLSVM